MVGMLDTKPLSDSREFLEQMLVDLDIEEEIRDCLMNQVCRIEWQNVQLGMELERERLLKLGQLVAQIPPQGAGAAGPADDLAPTR